MRFRRGKAQYIKYGTRCHTLLSAENTTELAKGQEKRGKRISNIEQGISNDEGKERDFWIPAYCMQGLAGRRGKGEVKRDKGEGRLDPWN